MATPPTLSPSEVEILRQGKTDPSVVTDYFFRPRGAERGWLFDENFTPDGAWQKDVHLAIQRDITIIGGFGTGKTSGIGMSASVWALSVSDFKFLNVAPKAWQAKLMYDFIMTAARNTRFEELIWECPRKPHPKIIIRYYIDDILYESTLEFMSVDKDGTNILSWEGDWLHIDEAGLIDDLESVIINTGSRLRGSVNRRERLGRFSMASNSWDNFYLWYYFDQASADPDNFLSIVVSSRANKNITEEQLARMLARIPIDERPRFIDGLRPEGRGWYFSKEKIYECEDPYMGAYVEQMARTQVPGYKYDKLHGAGVVNFAIPPQANKLYMFFGDPGVGAAPQRNAPTLMGWDVSNFPRKPAPLIAFWWGDGGGRIAPWVNKMFDYIAIYKPIYCGIDATGPQKNMNYLINEYMFKKRFERRAEVDENGIEIIEEYGYKSPLGEVKGIGSLDFSGSMKNTYLQAARLLIESQLLIWPRDIIGIRSQLSNYDPEKDKKIAQDIVATIGMSAHAIRTWFHVDPQALLASINSQNDQALSKTKRLPNGGARLKRSIRHKAFYR